MDDISVLNTIKNNLGFGLVSKDGNYCSFRVNSFQIIIEKLLPVFDKYPLLTLKQLDYKDWKEAIYLKFNSNTLIKGNSNYKRIIDNTTYKKILNIKSNMNKLRTNFDNYIISRNFITKYWLLGFVEGDGTFYFSNNAPVFGITQKDKKILEVISIFIENLNLMPIFDNLFVSDKPNCVIKNNKGAYQLVITDTDVLFQYIFLFF